ncbi:TraR/DksA family transcriptional regulator [Pseudodesulfovibrio piezophilus]|uniref:Transcriptional regulator, TraR/DksA family n=1 Tax=Pseudodesulfovibrio piezophilus (strain DSM 21447 / JCM 15486 / C1TLV30) TaxID=1322246 RepID=M1WSP6_PSEP2|nr:TraR/DksA family transcriptional regulator [Pseudodesulfovibrio piezophilus]CCH49017.1 Transcriptional regulator, TraR/DksA family [Pseudodesulfovibrio piezophilus C1TLV30]
MTETQRREIKSHLMQGLDSLSTQWVGESLVVENCPDETDFASQLAQQGVNVAMLHRRMTRMRELENALKRLHETDYGTCEECSEEIGLARLKANPSARLCVSCQSALEDGLSH